MKSREPGIEALEQRRQVVVEQLRGSPRSPSARRDRRPAAPAKSESSTGARRWTLDQGRCQLARRRLAARGRPGRCRVANCSRRVSVARDSPQEGREDPEDLGELLRCARAVVANTSAGVLDQSRAAGPGARRGRANVSPPLADELGARATLLAVEQRAAGGRPAAANGSRLAIATERSSPRPRSDAAWPCIQAWNAARVCGSKVRKISSSCTDVGDLRRRQRAALGQRLGLVAARASARRRSRRAASSGAGSPACPSGIGA